MSVPQPAAHDDPMSDASDDEILASLPTAYAVLVRLERAGSSDGEIAAALGVEVTAVAGLRSVASRKLAELRSGGTPAVDRGGPAM